jgi:alpha-galactosidase
LAAVQLKVQALAEWKFELVKHDFSTYDLLGQWGFEMGGQPSIPGWTFHDRGRTNAEIVLDFYRMLRCTLGDKVSILGCNTIGHLAAGVFELQRTGEDTSGQVWERTRRMGVNTLAYRLPQHRAFFHLDADCLGITAAVPWELNGQWLDQVARTGTALFVSPAEGAIGPDQRASLREAFAMVNASEANAEPADFFHETTPEVWHTGNKSGKCYQWCAREGALPFRDLIVACRPPKSPPSEWSPGFTNSLLLVDLQVVLRLNPDTKFSEAPARCAHRTKPHR